MKVQAPARVAAILKDQLAEPLAALEKEYSVKLEQERRGCLAMCGCWRAAKGLWKDNLTRPLAERCDEPDRGRALATHPAGKWDQGKID
jgi:hypothetical protein